MSKIYVKGQWLEEDEILSLYKKRQPVDSSLILQKLIEKGAPLSVDSLSTELNVDRKNLNLALRRLERKGLVWKLKKGPAIGITELGYKTLLSQKQ
ncbi:MAG: GntR family transcriptional regulator [Thermoprotei archaeon]